jgi:hypothetical protein
MESKYKLLIKAYRLSYRERLLKTLISITIIHNYIIAFAYQCRRTDGDRPLVVAIKALEFIKIIFFFY